METVLSQSAVAEMIRFNPIGKLRTRNQMLWFACAEDKRNVCQYMSLHVFARRMTGHVRAQIITRLAFRNGDLPSRQLQNMPS